MSGKDYIDGLIEEKKSVGMIDDDNFLLLNSGFQPFATGVILTWFDSPQVFLSAQRWEQQPIHLLVLNLYLGVETGKYWQPKLLAHECCQGVPIVIHSGSGVPGDRQQMMAMGAADLIVKAVDAGQMQHVVARMMAQLT